MIRSTQRLVAAIALASVACGQHDRNTPGTATLTIVVSGQSNAVGYSAGVALPPSPSVSMWNTALRQWVPARDPLAFVIPCPAWVDANGRCVSAWPQMARRLVESGVQNVKLTGFAEGGLGIDAWSPGGEADAFWSTLESSAPHADVFVWFQGESDAAQGMAEAYGAKLRALIARVRFVAHNPSMLVVICGLTERGAFMDTITAQQRNVASEDRRTVYVPTEQLPHVGQHLTAEGYTMLGDLVAGAIVTAR